MKHPIAAEYCDCGGFPNLPIYVKSKQKRAGSLGKIDNAHLQIFIFGLIQW